MHQRAALATIASLLQIVRTRLESAWQCTNSQVFSRYSVSSSWSPSSIFVSPPKTMNALPTSRLACPTLGPGPSEVVATGKQLKLPGPASTIHRSPFTVLPLIKPPMRYTEPSLLAVALTAAPYLGKGLVCETVKFSCREDHG